MSYNCKGDLYKREIVKILQDKGFHVKSVNALNKIMEAMGLLIHYGNGWGTTDKGAKFSMWHKGVLNSDAWHPEIVDERKILEILEKDFEELNKSELQILRNETRKIQGIQGRIKNDSLLDSYLNLKRKHVPNLEQVLVSPKLSEVDFGPFAGKQTFLNKVVVPTFESVSYS